jgi:hypothetical protein
MAVPAHQFRVLRVGFPIGVDDHSTLIEHLKKLGFGGGEIVDLRVS